MFDLREYAHPMDLALMSKILAHAESRDLTNMVQQNGLDQAYHFTLESSCARLPESSPIYEYLEEGQRLFGGEPIRAIYVKRDYDFEITCRGYNQPALVVPDVLARCEDPEIQRARILAGTAAAAAGHHRIEFLVWVLESMGGSVPLPFVGEAMRGILYEWYRSRYYTLDRAVYLATRDLSVALRNILFGHIPQHMLDRFTFGTDEDTFLLQVEELEKMDALSKTASTLLSIFEREAWLPKRYSGLLNFANKN